MNKNQDVDVIENDEVVLNSSIPTQIQQNDENVERFFCMPSVPRPGFTSWSLVL